MAVWTKQPMAEQYIMMGVYSKGILFTSLHLGCKKTVKDWDLEIPLQEYALSDLTSFH
jgi:hypothetical protein